VKLRLFNLAAAVSLILCVATVAVWVRSYWRMDELRLRFGESPASATYTSVFSSRGVLMFWARRTPALPWFRTGQFLSGYERMATWAPQTAGSLRGMDGGTLEPSHVAPGWQARTDVSAAWGTMPSVSVVMPHWIVFLVTAILPGVAIYRIKRDTAKARELRRVMRGACPKCSYDLRATPQRCPECGTVPATK
jgi:hypothetical protein